MCRGRRRRRRRRGGGCVTRDCDLGGCVLAGFFQSRTRLRLPCSSPSPLSAAHRSLWTSQHRDVLSRNRFSVFLACLCLSSSTLVAWEQPRVCIRSAATRSGSAVEQNRQAVAFNFYSYR